MHCFNPFRDRALLHGIQWPFHLWKVPFFKLAIRTQYGTVGECSHPLTVCRGQVWPAYGARKSALQMFVLYACFHLLLASWPSHSTLDPVFCLHELHGRNTGLQQLELTMQCISSPSQTISKRKEVVKLLADKKNIPNQWTHKAQRLLCPCSRSFQLWHFHGRWFVEK